MVQVGRDRTRPVWPRLQCPWPWFYLLMHQLSDGQLWPQLGLLCPQEGASLVQRQVWLNSWLVTASRDTMGIFSALSPGVFLPSWTLAEQEFVVFCSVSCSLQCELTALPLELCLLPSGIDKPVLALSGHCLVRPVLSFPGGSLTTPLSSLREWGPGWSWYPWWVSWRASQWPNPLVRCSPPTPSLAPQPGAQPALLACSPACFYLLWFLKLWIFIRVAHVHVFWKKLVKMDCQWKTSSSSWKYLTVPSLDIKGPALSLCQLNFLCVVYTLPLPANFKLNVESEHSGLVMRYEIATIHCMHTAK